MQENDPVNKSAFKVPAWKTARNYSSSRGFEHNFQTRHQEKRIVCCFRVQKKVLGFTMPGQGMMLTHKVYKKYL